MFRLSLLFVFCCLSAVPGCPLGLISDEAWGPDFTLRGIPYTTSVTRSASSANARLIFPRFSLYCFISAVSSEDSANTSFVTTTRWAHRLFSSIIPRTTASVVLSPAPFSMYISFAVRFDRHSTRTPAPSMGGQSALFSLHSRSVYHSSVWNPFPARMARCLSIFFSVSLSRRGIVAM